MPDYLQHGDRHRPGGSDPIPGLAANLPWGFIKNTNLSITSSTSLTTIDMTVGNTGVTGGTSGDSDIALESVGGFGGIVIHTSGLYLVSYSINLGVGSAPAANSVGRFSSQTGISSNVVSGSNITPWLAIPGLGVYGASMGLTTLCNVTTSLGVGLQVGQNSGVSAAGSGTISVIKISSVTSNGFT